MNLFVKRFNGFQQKVTSQIFEWVLNAPTQKLKILLFQNFKTSLKNVKTFEYFVYIEQNNSNNRKQVDSAA